MKKLYTTGEIYRLGLMLNRYGKPYGEKSQVHKAVKALQYVVTQTAHGQPTKSLPLSEIKKHNAKQTRILQANKE